MRLIYFLAEDGFLENFGFYDGGEVPENATIIQMSESYYKPRFDWSTQTWAEGLSKEEIEALHKPPSAEELKKLEEEKEKNRYVSEYELKEHVSKVATELSVAMAEMINGVLGG